jgi:hypothetical protein
MPDGAAPVKALSRKDVERIARRFDSLSPYNRAIVPHLLRLTDENFDKKGIQRQLYGLSIAAKRYALYTTKCGRACCNHSNCIEIVDPKAHGLIFFAPSDDREDVTGPSFCTSSNERVYITAIGCEIEFGGARELQAAGAGGL